MGMREDIDQLKADVAERRTVEESAVTFIKGIQKQLADALGRLENASDAGEFEDEIRALHDSLAGDPSGLAAAITSTGQPATGLTTPDVVAAGAAVAPQPGVAPADTLAPPGSGTAGDTQTGTVSSAGASPNADNVGAASVTGIDSPTTPSTTSQPTAPDALKADAEGESSGGADSQSGG